MKVLIIFLLLLSPALACALFFPKDVPGFLAEETALIVWDDKTKTEHFIRRASFSTEAKSLGFVVPTPSKPALSEVDDSLFLTLDQLTRPKIIEKKEAVWIIHPLILGGCSHTTTTPRDAGVQVLDRGTIAGQEYAVLKATDTEALVTWLDEHSFPFLESNRAWVEQYVKDGYFLTAFKYDSQSGGSFSSKTVKMTFKTAKPFYPYREPETKVEAKQRSLRLYLLSSERVTGELENGPWTAKVPYSAPTQGLPPAVSELGEGRWLTIFDDDATHRIGQSDLQFSPGPDQTEVHPPDLVLAIPDYSIFPSELVYLGFAVGVILWRKRRRRGLESSFHDS